MHLDGIHSKLVGIMKERLQVGIQQLREEVRNAKQTSEDKARPPSQASQQVAKQLRILTQVLTPILHEHQMMDICSNVAEIFGKELGLAFEEMIDEHDIFAAPPLNNEPQEDASPHPLDESYSPQAKTPSKTEEERQQIFNQKQQMIADCHFLVNVLSKLPIGDKAASRLAPLTSVAELLDGQ